MHGVNRAIHESPQFVSLQRHKAQAEPLIRRISSGNRVAGAPRRTAGTNRRTVFSEATSEPMPAR